MAPSPSPTATWHDNTYASLSPNRPELSAAGKTVLVTGGGTGIGAETARYFAKAGASRIALLGRREAPLIETQRLIQRDFPQVVVFAASTDVSDKNAVDTAFFNFVGVHGKIDVVVSAAAVTGPMDPVRDVDPTAFIDSVNVNIKCALFTAQAFLRHAALNAVAIDINSSAAHVNFGPGFSAYSVAKFANYRLWDSVSFANPDLRVFHIQPGVVDTDMNRAAGGVKMLGYEDHVSLPASFCVWLASPEAAFLNGRFLWVNWDVEELKSQAKQFEESERMKITLVGWPFAEAK